MQFTTEEFNSLVSKIQAMSQQSMDNHNYRAIEALVEEDKWNIKFRSWVKQTYPEVWEGWKALKDVEDSAHG